MNIPCMVFIIQENLLFQLIDLDVYSYSDLYEFFYHNPRERYTYIGDGEYILHKWSVWQHHVEDHPIILPCDVKAIITREGWNEQDYRVKYPGYIPINMDDLEEGINVFLDTYEGNNALSDMIKRRPYLFVSIYPVLYSKIISIPPI